MKTSRRWFCQIVTLVSLLVATGGFAFGQADHVRWDIVSINFAAGTINAGGTASARANDGSTITVTGSGTFVAPASGGTSGAATGGGRWAISGPVGAASGVYWVTGLVRWERAPGTLPPLTDLIGGPGEPSAGLAILRIQYSDGRLGTLTVSCHLVGTPDSVFEGITATRGFVDFFQPVPPVPGVDANRTLFHVR